MSKTPCPIFNEYRPIPLRRLTDLCANPDLITREEALLIRDNEIARREVIRIGLSPSKIISSFKLDAADEDEIFFQ